MAATIDDRGVRRLPGVCSADAVTPSCQVRRHQMAAGRGEISILYTNPTTKATYLIIRADKNAHVPRHWHTANETITILKGTFVVKHDDSDARSELTPGSFAYMPAKMVHEAWAKDDGATYFITTDGAFDINWVK